jgi:hypothetical protein
VVSEPALTAGSSGVHHSAAQAPASEPAGPDLHGAAPAHGASAPTDGHGDAHAAPAEAAGPSKIEKLKAAVFSRIMKAVDEQPVVADKKLGFLGSLREIAIGIFSKDKDIRIMSGVFFASCLGAVIIVGEGIHRFQVSRRVERERLSRAQSETMHLGEFIRRQAEEARHRWSMFKLGNFNVALNPIPGSHPLPGVMNMAEIEMIAACDSKPTRDYLESHLPQVKSLIISTLTAQDREELLSVAGKKKIKKKILEKLNYWLPKGKIEELYFTSLILS